MLSTVATFESGENRDTDKAGTIIDGTSFNRDITREGEQLSTLGTIYLDRRIRKCVVESRIVYHGT